jgi:predicted kinase
MNKVSSEQALGKTRKMKTLILILGAHAAGKSTLSRALCGASAQEYSSVVGGERVRFTYGQNGIALAGNRKSGSDGISQMEVLRQTVSLLLENREIVIVDGFRCSNRFVHWLQMLAVPQLAVLFVYLDLSLEANKARLLERRRANGANEEVLPARTHRNLLRTRVRAWRVFDYAHLCYTRQPRAFLVITESSTPDQAAARIWNELANMQSGGQEIEMPASIRNVA